MKYYASLKLFLFILIPSLVRAQADWSRDFEVHSPRENLYELPSQEFQETVMMGRRYALLYPVTVSKLTIPYYPLKRFFDSPPTDPVKKLLFDLAQVVSPFKNMTQVFSWLGLHNYPTTIQAQTPNALPELTPEEKQLPMGATLFKSDEGDVALTFGCAACHTADLFGVKVLGLTNRFPRANEFFRKGASLAPYVNTFIFKGMLSATEGERLILVRAKDNLKYVGTKAPMSVGLDTSLAQVALSLAKRRPDEYATKTAYALHFPRRNKLSTMVADSKPAVWWNLKYKNRWLSDGSIVSGNPVHTNFLWNEIGRGADLKELQSWLKDNSDKITALTAAVFASRSPRYEKFFGVDAIDLQKAQRGETHFVQSCQKCHGTYEKGWSANKPESLSKTQLIQNVRVTYHVKTPVKDVGTDPGRYLGMAEFADDLNRLAISKALGTVVEPQKGYVPPPLDGIWARWPYFHNNSVPNLCALLTPAPGRPVTYVAGPAKDKATDFDQECVGYPLGDRAPLEWRKDPEFLYDTRKEGLSNSGHDQRIFLRDGQEIYTKEQKLELIEFLKTL
jgi:mono/diheme cytochrome c family protein